MSRLASIIANRIHLRNPSPLTILNDIWLISNLFKLQTCNKQGYCTVLNMKYARNFWSVRNLSFKLFVTRWFFYTFPCANTLNIQSKWIKLTDTYCSFAPSFVKDPILMLNHFQIFFFRYKYLIHTNAPEVKLSTYLIYMYGLRSFILSKIAI